jgi:hypothetical protein
VKLAHSSDAHAPPLLDFFLVARQVILDEIDGADASGAIDALVSIIKVRAYKGLLRVYVRLFFASYPPPSLSTFKQAPLRHTSNNVSSTGTGGSGKKGKGGPQPLTRPLICVCNDPYSPHLRALREVRLSTSGGNRGQFINHLFVTGTAKGTRGQTC